MSTRIALLSDIHGNVAALEAVRKALKKEKPDQVIVAGDLVFQGPEPEAALAAVREMEAAGALVVGGNTDVAVADADYSAAFPWFTDGVPESFQVAAEWANDQLSDEALDWLRKLPTERRLRVAGGDGRGDPDGVTMVLGVHASPGSQTLGFDQHLDPSVTLDRMSRTDARVVCVGHTHVPEIREFGWRLIVNGGSAGWVFDGDPTASWALITIADGEVSAEIRRAEFDTIAVSNALSTRGLPGDVYRAATVRTGKLVR
jgi:predicted phosphodiesterase